MSYQSSDRTVDDRSRHDSQLNHAKAYEDSKSGVRDQIENVLGLHEQLVESRERLLLKRKKARTSAKRVQSKRIETGNAEVEFMDGLRGYMNEIERQLPLTLLNLYAKLVSTRNDLAVIEDDYLRGEGDLTGTEWLYLDQENDFYQFGLRELLAEAETCMTVEKKAVWQAVPPSPSSTPQILPPPPPCVLPPRVPLPQDSRFAQLPPPPPPPPLQPLLPPNKTFVPLGDEEKSFGSVTHELNKLKKQFNALREEQRRRIDNGEVHENGVDEEPIFDLGKSDFTTNYFDILLQMSLREVEAQRLKDENMQYDITMAMLQRRNSAPVQPIKPSQLSFDLISVACTETAVDMLANDPMAQQRICNWLLEYPEANFVERTLRSNLLQELGVSAPELVDNTWKELIIRDCRQRNHGGHTDHKEEISAFDNDTQLRQEPEDEYGAVSEELQSAFLWDENTSEKSTAENDKFVDPALIPLPSSPVSEQSTSPATAAHDSCESILCDWRPARDTKCNDRGASMPQMDSNSNPVQPLDSGTTFGSPSRTDSGCDLQLLSHQTNSSTQSIETSSQSVQHHGEERAYGEQHTHLGDLGASRPFTTLSHATWVQKDVLV